MYGCSQVDPSQRQVLVNLGNRYVVFGSAARLPAQLCFDPQTDSEILPRVADESEVAATRILETLRVFGMERTAETPGSPEADVTFSGKS
jgi:hypothetical protein